MGFSKAFTHCLTVLILLSMLSMISFSESREFHVGSKKGLWQIPSSPNYFNDWAQNLRFQIGDSIVLKYDGKTDSVLEVNGESYNSCNKSDPIKSYNDGDTKIVLDRSGPFYFISGAEGHCEKGQKMEIKVLSAKHSTHSTASPPAAPPSIHEEHHRAPAPAPHNAASSLNLITFIAFFPLSAVLALI